MAFRSVRDLDLEGKKLFLRLDLNVPLQDGLVGDTARMEAVMPTLGHCLKEGAAVVAASHLGRPKGEPDPSLSLAPVAHGLQTMLGWPVAFCADSIGAEADRAKEELGPGELLLLENLRFHPGEKKNDPEFAAALAAGCDLYVTDAFGTLHRAHASVVGVPKMLGGGAAGLLVEKELEVLGTILEDPPRPFVLILGGVKISTKLPTLRNMLPRVDTILLGGAMALTVLAARGEEVGDSLVEKDQIDTARKIVDEASEQGVKLLLPEDHVIEEAGGGTREAACPLGVGEKALDIGPRTRESFIAALEGARTILWNGPLGMFENEAYATGTLALGQAVAASGAQTLVGGGDSVAAIRKLGLQDRIGHVSTGGGAMLEYLSGATLPGVEAIQL